MPHTTDIKRLEYRFGQTPRRAFKPTAPEAGELLFQRLGEPREPVVTVIALHAGGADAMLLPHPIVYHSPTGLEWGYAGSGPADLAANVLALFLDLPEAWRLHQWFKFDCITPLAREGDRLDVATIRQWITDYWHRETVNPDRMEREACERRLWADAVSDAAGGAP